MNKKLIRLTESDLHRIVRMSVNRVLAEMDGKQPYNDDEDFMRKTAYDFPIGKTEITSKKELYRKGERPNREMNQKEIERLRKHLSK